jgi:hypothetical protein
MLKATTLQLVIMVARGFEAQIAWAGLPKLFQTFQSMAEAAGRLHRILQTSPSLCQDWLSAEDWYLSRFIVTALELELHNLALWGKVHQQC